MDHLTSASWYTNYNGFGEFVGEVHGLPQMQLGVDTERQFTPHDHVQYSTPVTSIPGDGLQYVGEQGVFTQEDIQQSVEEALPNPESHTNHYHQQNKIEKIIYIQQNTEDTLPCPESYTKHQHRPSKTGKIMCQECQATFACLANLRNHMRIHTGERPYVCEECGASFTQRSNLRSHKRVHTGERPYMCGICGQTFARSSHLPGHMRTHTGERPFKCSQCNRSFATNQIMKNHMRTHTGERPFVCEVCEATFAQSSCLATHKKIHTGERNFKCVRCGKAFISRSGLQTHERVHTGEKPYKCEKCSKSFKTSSYLSKHKQKYCGNSFTSKIKTPSVKKSVRKPNGTRKIGKSRKAVKVAGKPPKRNKSKRLKPPRRHHSDEFGVDNTANMFSSPECSTEEHFTSATHLEVKPEQGSLNFASSKNNTNHTDLLNILPSPYHLSKPAEEDFVKMEYHVYSGTDKDTLHSVRSLESQYNIQEVQSQCREVPTQQQMDTVDPRFKDVVSHDFSKPSICPQEMVKGTLGIHSQSAETLGIHSPLEGTLGIHSQAMQVLPPASSIAMGTVAQQSTFTSETNPVGWHSRNYM